MDSITCLPEQVLEYILRLLVPDKVPESLRSLIYLRCACKNLYNSFNDAKILDILQHTRKPGFLSGLYIINKLRGSIKSSYMASYSAFVRLLRRRVKSRWLSRLRNEQLLNVVRFSTVKFLREYLTRDFSHSQPSPRFTKEMIIKAIDIANDIPDGNEMLIYLFPMISQCFTVSDPQHLQEVMDHINAGYKLNAKGDNFGVLLKDVKQGRANSCLLRSLIDLVQKIQSPWWYLKVCWCLSDRVTDIDQRYLGKVFRQFKIQISSQDIKEIYSMPKNDFEVSSDNGQATVTYLDCRAKTHTIDVKELNGIYTYEGFSTDSLYELFVRTSIFEQVFGTFPQQHVALTEENIDLDPIDQPWFFGAISATEADEILSGASVYPAVMTRSIGSEIYVCFTRTKFCNEKRDPYRLKMKFRDILTRTDHSYPKFFSALYNGGNPKNTIVYHTYQTIVSKPLEDIRRFIEENDLKLSDPVFAECNILSEYVQVQPTIDIAVVQYLISQHVPVHDDTIIQLSHKCTINPLLDLNTLLRIIRTYKPDLGTFKLLWASMNVTEQSTEQMMRVIMYHIITGEPYTIPSSMKPSTLIRLAWRFGKKRNYIKTLPKEIIELICSYNIDRPAWWEISGFLIERTIISQPIGGSYSLGKGLYEFIPFILQYWDRFDVNFLRSFGSLCISRLPSIAAKSSKKDSETMVQRTLNFIQKLEYVPPFDYHSPNYSTEARDFFKFTAHNDFVVPLFKLISNPTDEYITPPFYISELPSASMEVRLTNASFVVSPATWIAAFTNNIPLIDYFVEQGLMHFDEPNCSIERLESQLNAYQCDLSVLDYIRQRMQYEKESKF